MQENLKKFKEHGANVVALCPQRQIHNQSIVSDLNLEFPVLRDADNRVSTAFGLTLQQPKEVIAAEKFLGLDLPAHNDAKSWDLPIPARYVMDTNSEILFAALHVDYRLRTDPLDCMSSMVGA